MAHSTREALIALLSTSNDFKAADAISEALPFAKGAMLFRFFQNIQAGLNDKQTSWIAPPDGFAGFEATRENCNKWFMPKGQKLRNVGMFFDIGRKDLLFRIEVATEALHFGVVPVKDSDISPIERHGDYLQRLPENLHHRNWKAFQWFSCLHKDYVAQDMDCLSDPSQFLGEIWQTLVQLQPSREHGHVLECDEESRTPA